MSHHVMPYQPNPRYLFIGHVFVCLLFIFFQCYTHSWTDKINNSIFCGTDLSPWTRFVIGNVNQFPKMWEPCLMVQISSMYSLVSHLCFDFLVSHMYCIVSLDCLIDFFFPFTVGPWLSLSLYWKQAWKWKESFNMFNCLHSARLGWIH